MHLVWIVKWCCITFKIFAKKDSELIKHFTEELFELVSAQECILYNLQVFAILVEENRFMLSVMASFEIWE